MFYLPGISLYTCHIRNGYVTSVMIFKKLHKISKYLIKSCILWDVPQYKTLENIFKKFADVDRAKLYQVAMDKKCH